MRIALLSDPNNFHTRKWTAALRKAGAEVQIFSFEQNATAFSHTQLQPRYGMGRDISFFSYFWGGKALRAALDAWNPDIVYALNITPYGVWARKSGRKPLVLSAMGADILEYPPPGIPRPWPAERAWSNTEGNDSRWRRLRSRLSRAWLRAQVRRTLHAADLVTGDNQVLVDCMRDWMGLEAARLLRWGVEPELFSQDAAVQAALRARWGIGEDLKLVLAPRGAKALYQADIILEAWERMLRAGRRDAFFLLLSAGYEISEKVRQQAARLQATWPRHFAFEDGILPRTEVYALWGITQVMVNAPVYDGYSAALAEARYAGVIPVVNDIPAHRELFPGRQDALFADPFTPEHLAAALETALNMPAADREALANRNRTWVETYSLLAPNARLFLEWCEKLTAKSH